MTDDARSLLEAARKLVPQIRACADETDATRELPRALFEALCDAGLFHMAMPRAIGGGEIDPPTYIQVIEELGKADASTGWVVNQCAIFATYSARMPHDVARAIWIDTPRSVVSNSPAATGRAVVVPGGYRVTARQGFSTGCRHASYVAAHCQVIQDGQPRTLEDGSVEARYVFVPVGPAGPAPRHLEGARDARHRDAPLRGGRRLRPRRAQRAVGGRAARGKRAALPDPAHADVRVRRRLGGGGHGARGAERVLRAGRGEDTRAMQGLLRDQPMVQADVGHAEANLRAARALLTETVREMWEEVTTTGVPSLDQRAALRIATTHAIRLCVQIIDSLYNAAGATGIYEGHLLQRYFQDIHVISQHMQSRMASTSWSAATGWGSPSTSSGCRAWIRPGPVEAGRNVLNVASQSSAPPSLMNPRGLSARS